MQVIGRRRERTTLRVGFADASEGAGKEDTVSEGGYIGGVLECLEKKVGDV